jgi:NADH-quinone oxidoreductase subunit L
VALMLAGLAVGTADGRAAGLAHLLSHAGFKALLFLAAGCVAHLVGSNLLRDMGGLRDSQPALAVATGLGLVALAGIPPLAGFVSKEAVLTSVEEVALHGGGAVGQGVAALLLLLGYATTFVTGLYAGRAASLVLLGSAPAAGATVPRAMSWPVLVLAVPTTIAGALLLPFGPALLGGAHVGGVAAAVGTLLAAAGAGVGLLASQRADRDVAAALPARLTGFLRAGYRLDDVQDALVVRPARRLARVVVAGDSDVVDAYVRGSAVGSSGAGGLLRRLQTGVVAGQLAWVVAGAVVLGVAGLLAGQA